MNFKGAPIWRPPRRQVRPNPVTVHAPGRRWRSERYQPGRGLALAEAGRAPALVQGDQEEAHHATTVRRFRAFTGQAVVVTAKSQTELGVDAITRGTDQRWSI